ncbi:MAG: STAS domain-containing protein [Anaerolineales bacterium]|nr:STAS domain-containing protein [Anaerolineales bacterium]
MFITQTEFLHSPKPITILSLRGELDATNYHVVINQAKQLYDEGTRNLLIDLSDLVFMASSGLVALHIAAKIMRGESIPQTNGNCMHAIADDIDMRTSPERHCKLLKPQRRIQKTLDTTGFSTILQIYQDRDAAIASF